MKTGTLIDTKNRWILTLFFALLGTFLVVRASYPRRISSWNFGDFQTLLAVRNWAEAGFIKTHFLWIPQGYAKITSLFDKPELNHHAHGVSIEAEKTTNRRMYTHYPSWYAVPFGVMAKIGFENKFYFQLLSIVMSLTALFLWFLYLQKQFGFWFGLAGSFGYALSVGFLGYCDSLANMPHDDLSRFGFILLLEHQLRKSSPSYLLLGAAYLVATLLTIDSAFFLMLWALLFFAWLRPRDLGKVTLALFVGGSLTLLFQFIQNTVYLGFDLALKDWWQILGLNTSSHTYVSQSRWNACLTLLSHTFGFSTVRVLILALITLALYPSRRVAFHLLALFICGAAYICIFPQKIWMDYLVRQFAPLQAFLYAALWIAIFIRIKSLMSQHFGLRQVAIGLGIVISVLFAWDYGGLTYRGGWQSHLDFPPREHLVSGFQNSAREVFKLHPIEKVYAQIGNSLPGSFRFWNGHQQVNPAFEYYVNAPILSFNKVEEIKRDLLHMWKVDPKFEMVLLIPKNQVGPVLKEMALHQIASIDLPQFEHLGYYARLIPYAEKHIPIFQGGR